ncbi:MAG: hypothetical protein HYW02_07590 [Deltaproteobacteria bacterium]|nr:hypothetical protein [Deltaproteobacteria bacterium]MBI2501301.1 hypothetical protein [Deltaproteobacteria bacterium]MBI4197396.1 hypothetical protein [Deltaproteobacteria bacterium]
MITAIDPVMLKKSGTTVKTSSGSQDFSRFMGAMAPAGYEATMQTTNDPNQAAVSHAAMTGLSGATASYHAPYYGTAPVSTASTGGGYPPMMGTQTIPPLDPGAASAGGGMIPPGGVGSAASGAIANPSQDFQEKSQLLNQMYDSSLNMLFLQAQVQDQNREFTLASNMLQSRDRTLHNMIQNMRGM